VEIGADPGFDVIITKSRVLRESGRSRTPISVVPDLFPPVSERALGDSGPFGNRFDRILCPGEGCEKVADELDFGALIVVAIVGSALNDRRESVHETSESTTMDKRSFVVTGHDRSLTSVANGSQNWVLFKSWAFNYHTIRFIQNFII
jgi:hypothetical protein